MSDQIHAFLSRWSSAERTGDVQTLATLLTEDFSGTGPLGFVLPAPAWLDRHRQGLAYEQFNLEEIQIRHYRDVAVVTARNNAHGTYRGQALPEALRATLVVESDPQVLRLACAHMSFIAGTRGSPPVPGRADSSAASAASKADRKGL